MARLDLQPGTAENTSMLSRDPNRVVPGLGEVSRGARSLVDGTETECDVEVGDELEAQKSDAECRCRSRELADVTKTSRIRCRMMLEPKCV